MQVTIHDDFDPKKIADSGQCFRITCLNNGIWRFLCGSRCLYLRRCGPSVYEADCPADEWNGFWHDYFDLGRDYRRVRNAVRQEDTYLRAAADTGTGIRILRQEPWEMIVTFLISQRKSIPAIRRCVDLLASRFGQPIETGYEIVYGFPSAQALARASHEDLLQCGLGYRAPYIEDAVKKVCSGVLDPQALYGYDDTSLMEALKSVHGIGEKVAGCISLFAYGRTGLAPVDTWIRRVINEKYGGADPFPQYGNMAGIMQQYLFYYAQTHKGEFD